MGEEKEVKFEMSTKYDPHEFEEKILSFWLERGFYNSDIDPSKPKYSIVIPPPNVTSVLHMGHGLNNTIQDVLIRYKRMDGYNAMWLPGTDHAGIATQNVVEKKLAKEGKNRFDLGRERFVQEVWKWKEEHGNKIIEQLKRIGASCDWRRTRFTMDEGLSRAVRTAFTKLFRKGLIYRGEYIINWCPRCGTALADDEVEHKEVQGNLWYIKYPFEDGSGFVVVATTRPETMLGDTAVAVNPNDERYKNIIGKYVILPLAERRIPIIADEYVDPQFGTGIVKITPGHDPNDFEIGRRHNLPIINILNPDGTLNENVPQMFKGLDRFTARKKVVEELEKRGLIEKVEPHKHNVGHCYRCDTIIEPYVSTQWFVRMKPLAEKAIKVAEEGKLKFYPERWKKVYLHWLENVKDWCISRQIWWGHRIPVWYCEKGHINVFHYDDFKVSDELKVSLYTLFDLWVDGRIPQNFTQEDVMRVMKSPSIMDKNKTTLEVFSFIYKYSGWGEEDRRKFSEPEKLKEFLKELESLGILKEEGGKYSFDLRCKECGSRHLKRDEDVLDTWFSSALWPFSTLGWPDLTPDLNYYYPHDVLVTAPEILFFWVARMVMTGLEFIGNIPFHDVALHGTVLDELGRKMSKSLGNGIDPLDVVKMYGADALRYTILFIAPMGLNLRLSMEKFKIGSRFANKIWNASRYILTNYYNYKDQISLKTPIELKEKLTVADKWIISEYQKTIEKVRNALDSYRFQEAVFCLQEFFWNKYCDWYLELSKVDVYYDSPIEKKEKTISVLLYILEGFLRLLHPIMPFITEEIWQRLPNKNKESIMIAEYPKPDKTLIDEDAEKIFEILQDMVYGIRNIRSTMNIQPNVEIKAKVKIEKEIVGKVIEEYKDVLSKFTKVSEILYGDGITKEKGDASYVGKGFTVFIPLGEIIDVEKERKRLEKEKEKLEEVLKKTKSMLDNPDFMSNAPEEVIYEKMQKEKELIQKITELSNMIESL